MTLIQNYKKILIKWLGGIPVDKKSLLHNLKEIQEHGGYLSDRDMEMISGILSISEWQIQDVMIPKNDVIGLIINDDYYNIIKVVCENEHSRYPVFDENQEKIIGVLMAKDLLKFVNNPSDFDMSKILREPIFQPVTKNLNLLLDDFRDNKTHIVFAVDENGLPVGIATIEDVLECIVGEIEDEFDMEEERIYRKTNDGGWIFKASVSVEEFNMTLKTQIPEDDFDSISAWLAGELGRLPKTNDRYFHMDSSLSFLVLEADDKRVYTLKIKKQH